MTTQVQILVDTVNRLIAANGALQQQVSQLVQAQTAQLQQQQQQQPQRSSVAQAITRPKRDPVLAKLKEANILIARYYRRTKFIMFTHAKLSNTTPREPKAVTIGRGKEAVVVQDSTQLIKDFRGRMIQLKLTALANAQTDMDRIIENDLQAIGKKACDMFNERKDMDMITETLKQKLEEVRKNKILLIDSQNLKVKEQIRKMQEAAVKKMENAKAENQNKRSDFKGRRKTRGKQGRGPPREKRRSTKVAVKTKPQTNQDKVKFKPLNVARRRGGQGPPRRK